MNCSPPGSAAMRIFYGISNVPSATLPIGRTLSTKSGPQPDSQRSKPSCRILSLRSLVDPQNDSLPNDPAQARCAPARSDRHSPPSADLPALLAATKDGRTHPRSPAPKLDGGLAPEMSGMWVGSEDARPQAAIVTADKTTPFVAGVLHHAHRGETLVDNILRWNWRLGGWLRAHARPADAPQAAVM